VIFASGLKYVGVGTTTLGWILCLVALAGGAYWLYRARPWENGRPADSTTEEASPDTAANGRGSVPANDRGSVPANAHPPAPPGEPAVPRAEEPGREPAG
jgi:hypothetical protein